VFVVVLVFALVFVLPRRTRGAVVHRGLFLLREKIMNAARMETTPDRGLRLSEGVLCAWFSAGR
jgi:hypothetical protein